MEYQRFEILQLRARFMDETRLTREEVDALSLKEIHEWFQIRDAVRKAQGTK